MVVIDGFIQVMLLAADRNVIECSVDWVFRSNFNSSLSRDYVSLSLAIQQNQKSEWSPPPRTDRDPG